MEIDDSILHKSDDEILNSHVTNTDEPHNNHTTNTVPVDTPMPPPQTQQPNTKTITPDMVTPETTTDDERYQSTSSTEDLRNMLNRRDNKLDDKIIVKIDVIVRERDVPEGKLYPSLPETKRSEVLLSNKSFHNDYDFHRDLQKVIRDTVLTSEVYKKMSKDGYNPTTKDKATYTTVDSATPTHKLRQTKLITVFRQHDHPNNYTPEIRNKNAWVLVKVDVFPIERDPTKLAKMASNRKLREEMKQKVEADERYYDEKDEKEARRRVFEKLAIKRTTMAKEISAEKERIRAERKREDEECMKQMDAKRQREKQQREQPYSLYPSNGLAAKNCVNAMKTLAYYDSAITDSELTFKLRMLYQEFLDDSERPENQITRRDQLKYAPRNTHEKRQRHPSDQSDDRPKRHRSQRAPTKPARDSWTSSSTDWAAVNTRRGRERHYSNSWDSTN